MNRMEDNRIIIYIVVGIVVLIAGFLVIPPLIKKLSGKTYKKMSKVTEDDFVNNGPQIVKKTETGEKPNDD